MDPQLRAMLRPPSGDTADELINVDLLYLATDTRIVLGPDDLDKARDSL